VNQRQEITVKTYKYDGRQHRSWQAEVLEQRGDLLVLLGVFNERIEHSQLGVIEPGTLSYEYYWLDRWYNVFRFHEPDGALRNYYCNINMPPKFEDGVLSYVDLDIDIYVSPELEVSVWDTDEFEEHSVRYSYPTELIDRVKATVTTLEDLIASRQFPFNDDSMKSVPGT
jgi:protein associated with RNAse G/E